MRARRLLSPVAVAVLTVACARFSSFGPSSPALSLTVTSAASAIHPAQYDLPVVVQLKNGGATALTGVRVSLAFDGTAATLSTRFRALESDVRADTVAAGAAVLFAFTVEVRPSARLSAPVTVDASATWTGGSLTGALTVAGWTPQSTAEYVVTSTAGGPAGIGGSFPAGSLDAVIAQADAATGLRRISFDPTVFPAASPRTIVLNSGLLAITGTSSSDLLIVDGSGAGVRLTPSATAEGSEQYVFTTDGPAVLSDLTIVSPDLLFPYFDLSADACNGGSTHTGGTLVANGPGATVLEDVTIDDSAVATRNCYASSVVLLGGSGHRVLHGLFTGMASDLVFSDVPMVEFSDNRVVNERNDVVGLYGATGPGLRVVRNLFVNVDGNVLRAQGATTDEIELWNDTIAGAPGVSPIDRYDPRPINIRNVVFANAVSGAIRDRTASNGLGLDIAHVVCDPSTVLSQGSLTAATLGTGLQTIDPGFTAPSGSDWPSFEPAPGSPLLDAGVDLIDVDGTRPGRFEGSGPDVGGVERGAVPADP